MRAEFGDKKDWQLEDGSAVLRPCQYEKLARGAQDKEHAVSQQANRSVRLAYRDYDGSEFWFDDAGNITRTLCVRVGPGRAESRAA
jgi:hypothetical protein